MSLVDQEENHNVEYKRIEAVEGKKNLEKLAKECVCFANAQGGIIYIGVDDKCKEPPSNQKISDKKINETLKRLRGFTNSVALANPQIHTHENGGEYFSFHVLPSLKTVAMTSDGKVVIRVGEECVPVDSQNLTQLVREKGEFQWELHVHRKVTIDMLPKENIDRFIDEIRNSDKVSDFIKTLDEHSLLEHFRLIDENHVTNLGILWLGDYRQRSRLSYPITVQYIVYDANEEKVRKEEWNFNQLNPKELLLDVEQKATELTYYYEMPKGLFREKIRQYPSEVIREILINAFAHKSYTISGDIFIRVYPDRLEVRSPGGFPLGITKSNILHQTRRKNPHIIDIFKALGMMEGEGSGYDLIYEKLSRDAKPYPEIDNGVDYVQVTVYSTIIDPDILKLIDYVQQHFTLTQKEIITLGVIAREKKISAVKLSKILQLREDRLRTWVFGLVNKNIVIKQGKTKGVSYLINPDLLMQLDSNTPPTLKTLEPHALRALIFEDLKVHPESKASEIAERLPEVSIQQVRKIVYDAVKRGDLLPVGERKNRKYILAKKK